MDLAVPRPTASQIRSRSERVSVATCSMRDRVPRGENSSSLSPQVDRRGLNNKFPAAVSMTSLQLTGTSKSSTMMCRRPIANQPLTEKILKIGREMDDPNATDLAYLFEDAKILHQKLMALNLDDVDLKKVGLFSSDTLETIESSARKLKAKSATLNSQRSSMASLNSVLSGTSESPYDSMSSLTNWGGNGSGGSMSKKSKSLKRSLFSVFGRSNSQKQKSERQALSRSLNHSRHSLAALTMPRNSSGISRSRPTSPVRKNKSRTFGRSNSLDFLDRDDFGPDDMESSPPPPLPLTPSPSSHYHSSSPPTPAAAKGYKMRLARSFSSLTQKKRDRSASLKPTAKSSLDIQGKFQHPNMDPGVPDTPTATSSFKVNGKLNGNHHTSNFTTTNFTDPQDYSEPKSSRPSPKQVRQQAQDSTRKPSPPTLNSTPKASPPTLDSTPKAPPPTLPKPVRRVASAERTSGCRPNGSGSSKRPIVAIQGSIPNINAVKRTSSQTPLLSSSPDSSYLSPLDHTQPLLGTTSSSPSSVASISSKKNGVCVCELVSSKIAV